MLFLHGSMNGEKNCVSERLFGAAPEAQRQQGSKHRVQTVVCTFLSLFFSTQLTACLFHPYLQMMVFVYVFAHTCIRTRIDMHTQTLSHTHTHLYTLKSADNVVPGSTVKVRWLLGERFAQFL